jgi:hypothetical protein
MDVVGIFGGGRCGINIAVRGAWLLVAVELAAWSPAFLVRGTIHKPVRVHLLPQMMNDGAATVADGAVDLCEGYCVSGVAYGDNGE